MTATASTALAAARARLGLTQAQAAELCRVSQPAWAQWESGARGVSLDRLERIAAALGCDLVVELRGRRRTVRAT